MGAANLQALKPILTKYDVRLVGVGVEKLGMKEFLDASGWKETLAIDEKSTLYAALGTVKHKWWTLAGAMGTIPVIVHWGRQASKLGYKGNSAGNKSQFGGTFAFDAAGNCVYAHRQDATSFEPDVPKMLHALGLSDDDVAAAEKLQYPMHSDAKG